MSVPKKYLVKEGTMPSHADAKPGQFVYHANGYDYGLADDDTEASGEEYISVSNNKFGASPFFTFPMRLLEQVESDIVTYPDDDHAKNVCKIGQAECCRYLTMAATGYSCAKHTSLKVTLDFRASKGEMKAIGDNCEGLYSR